LKYIFSGHDKFDCKVEWLSKALRYNKPLVVNDETIMHLGLGSNMIKSLNHWNKIFEIESFKELLKEKDPFFENLETLWILHFNLVKNATLYYLFFNKMNFYKFNKDDIFNYIINFIKENNLKISENTIKNDIDVFFRIYSDLFKELNLIKKYENFYKLNIKTKNEINDKLFLYFLADFIKIIGAKNSISLFTLQNANFSLQKSLVMSESALIDKLYRLEKISNGIFVYNESATLREVYILKNFNKKEFLEDVYNEI